MKNKCWDCGQIKDGEMIVTEEGGIFYCKECFDMNFPIPVKVKPIIEQEEEDGN